MDDSAQDGADASISTSPAPASNLSRAAAAKLHYARLRQRVDNSTPALVRRRARELDIVNHALILASLSLTLLVPALITLAAFLPIGSGTGLAAGAMKRLGITAQAAADLRRLFPSRQTVGGSTTALSGVITLFFAIGWPAELGRGFQSVWGLPPRGLRDSWRTVPWLFSFFAVLALIASSGRLVSGLGGVVVTGLVAAPVTIAWSWWGQHLLLGGRIGWRALLPGAIATSLLLFGFGIGMHIYLPHAIVQNFNDYGPIGLVLALLSWIIGFSVVMLAGPLIGHTVHVRRHERAARHAPATGAGAGRPA